jgi:hypothetical protein
LLYAYCQERHIPHKQCGKLIVATSASQVAQLASIQAKADANGVLGTDQLRLLSAAQALGVANHDPQALRAEGAAEADEWRALGWHGALLVMRDEFPVYLTEFGGLLAQSPPAYAPLVDLLIRHEVAFIDFATAELAGQADGMDVLGDYLVWARAA